MYLTFGRIAGTSWTAVAPYPMTATRLSVGSKELFQCAAWISSPLNFSRPGSFGHAHLFRLPVALTKTSQWSLNSYDRANCASEPQRFLSLYYLGKAISYQVVVQSQEGDLPLSLVLEPSCRFEQMSEADVLLHVVLLGNVPEIVANFLAGGEEFGPTRIVGKGVLETMTRYI